MIGGLVDRFGGFLAARKMATYLPIPGARSALVLLDVQRDLFDPDAGTGLVAEVAARTGYWASLCALVRKCRAAGVVVVHSPIAAPKSAGGTAVQQTGLFRVLREAGATQPGTPGSEVPPDLVSDDDVILAPRGTMNAFYGTDLEDRIESRGVTHLVVAGSVSNASVDSTARMGVELDYWVGVASDCVCAMSQRDLDNSLEVTLPRIVNTVAPGTGLEFVPAEVT